MFLDRPAQDLRDDSTWPDLYTWFGAKVTLLYAHIAPKLREELDRVGAPPATS